MCQAFCYCSFICEGLRFLDFKAIETIKIGSMEMTALHFLSCSKEEVVPYLQFCCLWPSFCCGSFNLEALIAEESHVTLKYETVCLVFASSREPSARMFLAFSHSESSY